MTTLSRRETIAAAATLGASLAIGERRPWAIGSEVRFDFNQPFEGWETVTGNWDIEEVPGSSHGKALVQRATNNAFNVIVAPHRRRCLGAVQANFGKRRRIRRHCLPIFRRPLLRDPSQRFGGQLQFVLLRPEPASDHWRARERHKLRIKAEGDHIKGWLNDQLLIDHHDSRFTSGRVGLWTKADSITAFDDLVVSPIDRG
jgi:hypothetical protein